jgi:S1-C subfamily serine protease
VAPPVAAKAPRKVPPVSQSQPTRREISTGSGFIVSTRRIVTNFHVVDGCTRLAVRFGKLVSFASTTAISRRDDLALITPQYDFGVPAPIRWTAALGEEVTAAGYPLSGLLSNDLIVTSGQGNSLAGIANDPSILQISAPIQPGSSGGPLIDRSGAIVGVVKSKLNVERISKLTGDLAQNVNFAIKPEVLQSFLDSSMVAYGVVQIGPKLDGIQIAERARQFTVQVICEK